MKRLQKTSFTEEQKNNWQLLIACYFTYTSHKNLI